MGASVNPIGHNEPSLCKVKWDDMAAQQIGKTRINEACNVDPMPIRRQPGRAAVNDKGAQFANAQSFVVQSSAEAAMEGRKAPAASRRKLNRYQKFTMLKCSP
jgi:hypothetical protein